MWARMTTMLLGAMLLVAQGAANAMLIGVCTFAAGGCGPDFAININNNGVVYTYNNGTDEGILSITGVVGNASFVPGQLDASWTHGDISQDVGFLNPPTPVTTVATDDDFFLTFTVDSNGNLISGVNNVTMNGAVFDLSFPGPTLDIAKSFNGTDLDGALITGGSISQIGWDGSVLDFLGVIDNTSLLTTAGFKTGLGGLLALGSSIKRTSDGASLSSIVWDESWTATGTLDVVVPVPAAFWLLLSGLAAVVSIGRKQSA